MWYQWVIGTTYDIWLLPHMTGNIGHEWYQTIWHHKWPNSTGTKYDLFATTYDIILCHLWYHRLIGTMYGKCTWFMHVFWHKLNAMTNMQTSSSCIHKWLMFQDTGCARAGCARSINTKSGNGKTHYSTFTDSWHQHHTYLWSWTIFQYFETKLNKIGSVLNTLRAIYRRRVHVIGPSNEVPERRCVGLGLGLATVVTTVATLRSRQPPLSLSHKPKHHHPTTSSDGLPAAIPPAAHLDTRRGSSLSPPSACGANS